MGNYQKNYDVLDEWKADFGSLITQMKQWETLGWETVGSEELQKLLTDEEKALLSSNGLHFNLPEGIGDAYDLRSQVQAKMSAHTWKSIKDS